jgi:uncharacterized protein (TIGR02117 family)
MSAAANNAERDATTERGRWGRARRFALRALLVVLAPFAFWGLAAVTLPRISVNDDWAPPTSGIEVGVLSNGVHTDFVLPVRAAGVDWAQFFALDELHGTDSGFEWVAVGWGDRRFYLETPTFADLKASTAFAALSGIGSTALHVTWLHSGPYSADNERSFVLSEAQYLALCEYVRSSFARDAALLPRRIEHPGYMARDHFYEAVGSYSAIQTCNEWTGAGLRRAGVRTGVWTPFAGDVLRPLPR